MKTIHTSALVAACGFLLALAPTASAAIKLDLSSSLIAGDATQLGRLNRTGVPSDWSVPKTFPGPFAAGINVSNHYQTFTIPAANLGTARFVQISLDDANSTLLASAYRTAYAPDSVAANRGLDTNYLGDAGGSGNSFAGMRFFQVEVPPGENLVVVVNETSANVGLGLTFRLLVEAFTDTNYTDYVAFFSGKKPSRLNVLKLEPPLGAGDRWISSVSAGLFGSVTINPDGTLIYTPNGALPAGGDLFTYTVADASGDLFTVFAEVHNFGELLGNFSGVIKAAPGATLENRRAGSVRTTVSKSGQFTAKITLGTDKFSVKGFLDEFGLPRFGRAGDLNALLQRKPTVTLPIPPDLNLVFQLNLSGAFDRLAGTLAEMGTPFASFTADRALYSKDNPLPADKAVTQTVMFTVPVPIAVPPPTADKFPQGNGAGFLKVDKKGVVKLVAGLADGSKVSCGNPLGKGDTWPFYASIFKGQGSVSGTATFEDLVGSDLDGIGLNWFKPAALAQQKTYPDGWPAGLTVNLLGSKFDPKKGLDESVLPLTIPAGGAGNADIFLDHGNLVATIDVVVDVTTKNKVLPLNAAPDLAFKAGIAGSGLFGASFVHTQSLQGTKAVGVILQKQKKGVGYFLDFDSQQAGGFSIVPK